MAEFLQMLQAVGLPTGAAAGIILLAISGDNLLKRYAEQQKDSGHTDLEQRRQMAEEQAQFRSAILDENSKLRDNLREAQGALAAALGRHQESERRVVELQMTVARLAAALLTSGIKLPAGGDINLFESTRAAPNPT